MAVIAVDFDGTVAMHEYPNIGADVPHAQEVLKRLIDEGHQLILWTMRCDEHLNAAVQWFIDRGIQLTFVNDNPQQLTWTTSRKIFAHVYIDDAALGCPLIVNPEGKPYVDWNEIEDYLIEGGFLSGHVDLTRGIILEEQDNYPNAEDDGWMTDRNHRPD